MDTAEIISFFAKFLEGTGVLVITIGVFYSLLSYLYHLHSKQTSAFNHLKQGIGKTILLWLEILIAGDIVATIITKPSLEEVGILGMIILIRTFLSLSLHVEVDGRFPWQEK